MKSQFKPEGFAGQKLLRLGKAQQSWCRQDAASSQLFVTDIGFYPQAERHRVDRPDGAAGCVLILCTRGRGWVDTGGGEKEVKAGEFFFIPARRRHGYGTCADSYWSKYWVHFEGEMATEMAAQLDDATESPQLAPEPAPCVALFEEMISILEAGPLQVNLSRINFRLWHLLSLFIHREVAANRLEGGAAAIESCLHFLRTHVGQRLSLEAMASHAGLSPSRFSALFRQRTGTSPLDFHIQLKMQEACRQLVLGRGRIQDVAASLGYDNPYYFSRLFRQVVGHSPRQYRERFQA
ncbi:MAG: hypothetical protein RL095_635 [Verrucomicrobiota bacterium]|jgi:AraC-like DNA-binding protein